MAMLLLFSAVAPAQSSRHNIHDPVEIAAVLDTVIQKRMERYHIPGFSIAIVKDGKLFWSKGYGYADLESNRKVEAGKTIFRIGSITKVFTATAMMQLVDEGKIRLSDDINIYLDDKLTYKNGVPVTLHHLLSHSEGFREITGRRTQSADKIFPLSTFLKSRLIQDHAAGEIGHYGTYGIALSGLLLERLSGMPYRDYLQNKFFQPLQMDHTNATTVSGPDEINFATGYEFSNDKYKKMAFEYYHTFPASDINSTVTDMANFMIMHLNNGRFGNNTVLQPQTALSMRATQFRNHPRVVGFGYGFWESTINGTKAVHHGGIMDGYASSMYLWPDKNMGVFMVCNMEAPNFLGSILNNFLYYFFPEPSAPVDNPDASLKTNLERFAGHYQRPYASAIDIKLNADSTLSFWGGRWVQIEPLLFRVVNGTLDTGEDLIAFKENEKGEIIWMTSGPFVYFK
ncbi:MAG: serine hydrolase domain-containing protein [Chitinophagaceae bacterium]